MRTRRSRRRCGRSTTSSGPARSTTTACRTSPAGSSRRPCTWPVRSDSPSRSRCSRSTPCIVREIEWEVVPAVLDAGMGMLPWSPLGGGWLSGKYQRDQRPSGDTRLGDDPGRGMEAWERRGDRADLARSSTPCSRWPRGAASRWRRSRWRGSPTGRASPRRSSAPARSSSSRPTCGPTTCASPTRRTQALDEASDLGATDYPYGPMGIEQQGREPRRSVTPGGPSARGSRRARTRCGTSRPSPSTCRARPRRSVSPRRPRGRRGCGRGRGCPGSPCAAAPWRHRARAPADARRCSRRSCPAARCRPGTAPSPPGRRRARPHRRPRSRRSTSGPTGGRGPRAVAAGTPGSSRGRS